jgi:hypothetical protein
MTQQDKNHRYMELCIKGVVGCCRLSLFFKLSYLKYWPPLGQPRLEADYRANCAMRGSCNETRWLTILVTFNTLGDDMLYTMDRNLLNSRTSRSIHAYWHVVCQKTRLMPGKLRGAFVDRGTYVQGCHCSP